MHSMPNFAVLKGESRHESSAKQQKAAMFVSDILEKLALSPRSERISLHFKSTDLYLFCTTKVFPKFLLPFQSQESFQSEQFGSYDYSARSLSLVACSLTSQRSRMLMQKRPLLLIDMSILTEKNTGVKETEKLSKYKDLEIEIERMSDMKATKIPVVIAGALGLIQKGLEKYIQQIPGNIKIYEVQKIRLLGTSHILRKALSIK